MIEFGKTLLKEPKTLGECRYIFKSFAFKDPELPLDACIFINARRLVSLNNEIYNKLHGSKE